MRDRSLPLRAPLQPFAFAPNVHYDPASAHAWDSLNETLFLERVFGCLQAQQPERFARLGFHVFSPNHPDAIPASAAGDPANKVLLFISDESGRVPTHLAAHYLAIFKIHQQRDPHERNIFALNLGYMRAVPAAPPMPVHDRPVGIFFAGNLSAARLPLYRELNPALRLLPAAVQRGLLRTPLRRVLPMDFSGERDGRTEHLRFTSGFGQGMSPAAYGALLGQAKIVLCPKGFLWSETFRHVEAMRAGAIVVSEPLPDTYLYRGAPIVRVADWRIGLAEARRLAGDRDALAALQAAHIDWYEGVLSEAATARAIWDRIAPLLGG